MHSIENEMVGCSQWSDTGRFYPSAVSHLRLQKDEKTHVYSIENEIVGCSQWSDTGRFYPSTISHLDLGNLQEIVITKAENAVTSSSVIVAQIGVSEELAAESLTVFEFTVVEELAGLVEDISHHSSLVAQRVAALGSRRLYGH